MPKFAKVEYTMVQINGSGRKSVPVPNAILALIGEEVSRADLLPHHHAACITLERGHSAVSAHFYDEDGNRIPELSMFGFHKNADGTYDKFDWSIRLPEYVAAGLASAA